MDSSSNQSFGDLLGVLIGGRLFDRLPGNRLLAGISSIMHASRQAIQMGEGD